MKIAYINGYLGENSTKPKILSSLLDIKIDHLIWDHKDKESIKKITKLAKDYDLIIASSTGAYIARGICEMYNIPLVSLNPVVDIDDAIKLIESNGNALYSDDINSTGDEKLSEIVFVTADDELLNYKKAINKYDNVLVINEGGHRFNNLKAITTDLKMFIKHAVLYSLYN